MLVYFGFSPEIQRCDIPAKDTLSSQDLPKGVPGSSIHGSYGYFREIRVYFFRFKHPIGCGKVGQQHRHLVVVRDRIMLCKPILELCRDIVNKLNGQSLFLKYVYPKAPFNIPIMPKIENTQITLSTVMSFNFPLITDTPLALEDERKMAFQVLLEELISKHFKHLVICERVIHFPEFHMSPFPGGGDVYILKTLSSGDRTCLIKPQGNRELGTRQHSEPPGTREHSELPGTSQSSESPGTSQSSEPPGTSQPSEPPGTSQSFKLPGTSQSSEPPGTSQQLAEWPGTSQSSEQPGTSQSSEPSGTSQSSEPPGTSQPSEPPGTSQPSEPPGTSQQLAEWPGTSQSSEQPGTSQSSEPSGTSQSSEPPGTSQPSEPPGTSQPPEPPGTSQPSEPPGTSQQSTEWPGTSQHSDWPGISGVNVTPPKGEIRAAANLELKYSDSHTSTHILKQLQANMLRCAAHEYAHYLVRAPSNSEAPNIITCYGLTFGVKTDIILLKLTVDFKKKELFFKTRINVPALQIPHNLHKCWLMVKYVTCGSGLVIEL